MTEKPIIFSSPMVRALLDGNKTQTRRILKPQPAPGLPIGGADFVVIEGETGRWCWLNGFDGSIIAPFKVPHRPGDKLWVRENWTTGQHHDETPPRDIPQDQSIGYLADLDEGPCLGRIRPSIHMPRWASRLTLTVTDVRVECLQNITKEDALAEGVHPDLCPDSPHIVFADNMPAHLFGMLWESINGAGSWDENPWVVAYTFEVEPRNIDK